MTSRYRPRRQFRFLLYQDIPMEQVLTDFIARLKGERKFVTTLKNALRLIGSLQERDLSYLYELFPWIREAIISDMPPPPAPPDSGELQQQISAAVAVGVQQAMLNMPSLPASPAGYPAMKQSGTLGMNKTIAMPVIDDDSGDTIVLNKTESKGVFMDSMQAFLSKDHESTTPSRRTRFD